MPVNHFSEVPMRQAKRGDAVKVHYTGKTEDGDVFDSSRGGDPFQFTIGGGETMSSIENSVIGMEVGDKKRIRLSSDEAFGPRREELVVEVKKEELPNDVTPAIGQRLQIRQGDDHPVVVTITNMNDVVVTLDANHPLAGHTVVYDLELIEIL
jgi:peptidylprolyl isomerase